MVSPQVMVLGTLAEEDGGGPTDMIRDGAFEGLDVVFMAHPSKEDATCLPCVAEHEYISQYRSPAVLFFIFIMCTILGNW